MIPRINLLPPDYNRKRAQRQQLWGLVALGAALCIIFTVHYLIARSELQVYRSRLLAVDVELRRQVPRLRRLHEYEQAIATMRNMLTEPDIVRKSLAQDPVVTLQIVRERVPARVWFHSIELTGDTIQLSASSNSYQAITTFVRGLTEVSAFHDVRLLFVSGQRPGLDATDGQEAEPELGFALAWRALEGSASSESR